MKKTTLLSLRCLFLLAFTQVLNAQQIYTNGPLSTGATSENGFAAAAGTTWSELQHNTGNTTESNNTNGVSGFFITSGTTSFRIADDFVVPTGAIWNTTSFDFFCYQTGFAGNVPPIDILRVQIFNGDPSAGGVSVAGDMTSNVYDATNSADALMFRVGNSSVPIATTVAPGITRKLWRVRGNLTAALPAGTYWVVYQVHPTNDVNCFFPPVTIVGTRGLVGWNSKQLTVPTLAWASVIDLGNPAAAPDVPQDMPFIVNGTVSLGVNENSFDASISLSPNPVRDMLSISVATGTTINSYEIFDLNGKVVKAINNSTSSISEINVSELSVGNYILKLQSDKGIASKKFIKE